MLKKPTIEQCAIVILAAGTSSRMGSPKQLLSFKGKNLLIHSVDAALGTGCQSVFVVLGAAMDLMRKELTEKPVIIVENAAWKEGMVSSIHCGLEKIAGTILRPDCVIFMVCDQPFISSSLLLSLLEKRNETGMPIVAGGYDDQTGSPRIGTPALFHKSFFPALMQLKGDAGARKIIQEHRNEVATVSFPEGIIDIDTPADYEALQKN